MNIFFSQVSNKKFYISYFFLICLYVVFLRITFIPVLLTYSLYGLAILVACISFSKWGLYTFHGMKDVFVIQLFLTFYVGSSFFYLAFGDVSDASWIVKDWLYSLLPILFYVLVRRTLSQLNIQIVLLLTIYSIVIIDIISLINFLFPASVLSLMFEKEMLTGDAIIYSLSGVLGVIGTGFINVLGLAICLLSQIKVNNKLKISFAVLFVVCALLTGQRTPIGGLVIVFILTFVHIDIKKFLMLGFLVMLLSFVISKFDYEVEGFSVKEVMLERTIERLSNTKDLNSNREDQHSIVIGENALEFLYGGGVGLCSPENPASKYPMPDAMMFRIFNEMGLIGLSCYILFFIINIRRAFRSRNKFMIAIIIYVFFANFFNRVLFLAPISIIPYILIAQCNWIDASNMNINNANKRIK